MTVYGKKKESTGKNKEASSKNSTSGTSNVSNGTLPNVIPHSDGEVNVAGRDLPEPHPHLAISSHVQSEEPTLRSKSSGTLPGGTHWSHSQNLSLVHANSSEIRGHGQSHYDYHMESNASGLGKRRRRLSPVRNTRTKLSRVERDRTNNSSPNTCATVNSVYSIPSPTIVESKSTAVLSSLPMVPSPEGNVCNSEDEHESTTTTPLTEEEWVERERRFEKKLRKKGLRIKQMGEDGACLFRAVADQVYGDQEMHDVVRKHCMDYIAANRDYYSPYVTEDFKHYVSRKRHDNCHGNHIEIQAMCEMYNRTIEVFCYGTEPINAFHGVHQTDNAPIRLSYHRGVHYNSVIDPYKATIGVGLGLPGNHPGMADTNMLSEAVRQNEDIHIEQAMLEDKLLATDWEATNEAIEEQVSRESYLQWLKDNERRNRSSISAMASSSSSTVTSSTSEIRPPRARSHGSGNLSPLGSPYRSDARNSPSRHSPPPSVAGPSNSKMASPNPHSSVTLHTNGISSPEHTALAFQFIDPENYEIPTSDFDLNEWDDAGILAQVLAASQQEYFDSLKRSREISNSNSTSSTTGSHAIHATALSPRSDHQD